MAETVPVKFRASSVGSLLVGGNAITDKQLERLKELEARKLNSTLIGNDGKPLAKPLTVGMEMELDELIAKRDAGFEFGATAMSYIRDCWLKNTYSYEEPVVTNEILKGLMCEDEAINLIDRLFPGGFRVKNGDRWEDDHFIGTPDIIGDDWVEDVKCSYTIRTFFEVRKYNPLYYTQGQVYMALTGRKFFRLAYVLLDTPMEIVEEEKKKFYFRFNCDEENPHYLEAIAKVEAMHGASKLVPEKQRVKVYEFRRDDEHLALLRSRVEQARDIYASITLGGDFYE